jgi:hypothetical protein
VVEPVMVIDLHACHASRPFAVDIGTMRGTSARTAEIDRLADLLARYEIGPVTMDNFPAERQATITKAVADTNRAVLQCEINSDWLIRTTARPRTRRWDRVQALAWAFSDFIAGTGDRREADRAAR